MDNINIGLRSYTIILLITTLSFIAGSNINCNGKAFHCVNSTHFKICVDLGHGVSMTVDEFLIPCPQNTVCKQYNLFECEYEVTTTLPPVEIQSEVTNENLKSIDSSVRGQLDVTTLFPSKQQDGMELSEKYYNKINATPASFTESFLTGAVIDSVNTSNANDLHTSSNNNINKTLNISLSSDKELTSITESGIDVPRSLYNINTLVTDTGVNRKYNTETPVFFSTTQDRRIIDYFKMESVKPFNQNSLDLDASYTVTKRTNQVSSVSEWRYSAVTLLPSNFSDPSLQENTPRKSNINHLITSDNTTQDNLDILFKYNTTQLNNLDNNIQYRNIKNSMYSKNTITDINTLNSTPLNVIKDEIFTSGVSDINRKSKVNSDIMLKPSGQNLAEITTASTIIVPGTTNQFSSHISLNTGVIETFFNEGLNIPTNLEKLSISDGNIISSIILDKKNATSSNKPTTSDTKPSKLRSDSEILNLKDEFEVNFATELNKVNNSQYLTTTEQYFPQRSDIPITSTSKSEVTAPININKVLPLRSKVDNALQINYVNTNMNYVNMKNKPLPESVIVIGGTDLEINNITNAEESNNMTGEISKRVTSLKPISGLISKNESKSNPVMVTVATDLGNKNITTTEESRNITAETSNGVLSLKPSSYLNSNNETRPKSVMVTIATDLDNNNMTTTEENNNMTAELSNGVMSLKPISDLISKNETRPKPVMVTVATGLGNKNITTTEESRNITAETSNGVSSLKPSSDLNSNNETWPKPVMVTIATDLDNNNMATTEENNYMTAELSNGVTSPKPISDLISKNETRPKPVLVTVAKDLDNKNVMITEGSSNITGETSNGVLSLKSTSDLIPKNETRPKPVMVTVATDLGNKNITTTEESRNITAETSNGVLSLKSTSDLIPKNETRPKPVMVTVATDLGNKNITTTEESRNITAETSNGVSSLKPSSDLISNNETRPKPVMVTIATDLDNNNMATTEENNIMTAELSNGVTSPKPISDLISKNETRPKPVLVTVAKDLDNKNVMITEGSSNKTGETFNIVLSLKSTSDLISKNETRPKPVLVTVAKDLDNKNVMITEGSSNITGETSNGVLSLKSTSDLISKNETRPKPVMVTVATDLGNKNITTTEENRNITAETSNGVSSLKPSSDLNSNNETRPKPVMVTIAIDLDNNNMATTEENNNMTAELSNGVTSLKPMSDLISRNETRPKPVLVTVAKDLDNKNVMITERSSNITGETSNRVLSLKSTSDLISKNETRPKPVMVTVAMDLINKNVTTTEGSSNITAETSNADSSLKPTSDFKSNNETRAKPVMVTVSTDLVYNNVTTKDGSSNITAKTSNGISSLKPTSDLISKNETRPKSVLATVAKDLDIKNVITTEESSNITAELSKGVTSLKPISDLISKNETRLKAIMVTVGTDLGNKNVTTTEGSSNITAKTSNAGSSFKPTSDLISMNETRPKPVIVTIATDLDNNNIATTEENNNMTAELSNGFFDLKSTSDLISKNETQLKAIMLTVGPDLGNKNVTTTEGSSNITAETSNAGSSFKPILDLKSNNKARAKPVMVTVATDLVYNNVTTKDGSSNITAETSNGISSPKPTSDLISKNETRPKSVLVTVAKDLDIKNVMTTEGSSNITAELSKGVTSLKPISDLNSKNETRPKPVMVTVATDLGNKNITTTEESSNITAEISNGVTRLTSISDLVSKNEPSPTSVIATVATNTIDSFHKVNIFRTTSTILTDHQSLDESTTSLSSIIKIPYNILKTKHFNKDSVGLISSTDSAISDLPTTLDKPTTLTDKSSGVINNNKTTHNNDTTKPIINSLYEINKALSYNYTHKDNRTSDVYQSTTENDRAFNTVESLKGPVVLESSNSMNVTNNTFIVNDMLSEHRAVSDNNKNIENTSKLESKITTKPSSYFDRNKSSINVISSDTKNVTTLSSQSAKNEMNTKRVIYKNTSDKGTILGKSSFINTNLTKPTPENNLIPKLVTNNYFSLSRAFHITYMNHNITDKNNNSLKDIPNKSVGVINTYFNYPDKNVVPSVSNNSKNVPLIYLNNSLTKLPLTDIYNVSHSYFSKNISQTVNKTTASNKNHDIEEKDSSQTNKSGHVLAHAFSIIEHERNKTEYLLLNPYTQDNTPSTKINDTTLKELTYNFSEPSFTVKNNVKHDFIVKNITTSTSKNTAPKGFYGTKGSGYDKSHSTTTIKSVNTNNCTNCSKLSELSNSPLSGNVIKPLLVVKESLQEEKNSSILLLKNGNLFSEDILNNWGVVNTTLVADITKRTKTFTHDGNVSEVNSLSFIKTTEKYMNKLNASSESNSTANLLRNMSSQTNIIKNMTHDGMSSNRLQFSRIPSQFDNSSLSGLLKIETIPLVLNRTKFEIFNEQEKNTISEYTNQSNRIERKLLTNGHGQSESNFTIANSVTQNIRNNTQNRIIAPINSINYPNKHYRNLTTKQEFRCSKRGKFSDTKDCTKFFVCIGRVQPVMGLCPTDSVFSEYLKQCTKNVTHCIRNNQFKCTAAGKFINILSNNTYFICAKQKSSFIKFTFQCQKSYYLDKNSIKCIPQLKNIPKSDESSSQNTKEISFDKSKKMEGVSIKSKNVFECEKEGKFKDPQDCRKYYVCKKGRNSIYRRKIKQCDSNEMFHKKKMECVDVESYECDI